MLFLYIYLRTFMYYALFVHWLYIFVCMHYCSETFIITTHFFLSTHSKFMYSVKASIGTYMCTSQFVGAYVAACHPNY